MEPTLLLNDHCLTSVAVCHNARQRGQCRPRCMGWLLILSAFIAMHVQMVRKFHQRQTYVQSKRQAHANANKRTCRIQAASRTMKSLAKAPRPNDTYAMRRCHAHLANYSHAASHLKNADFKHYILTQSSSCQKRGIVSNHKHREHEIARGESLGKVDRI